MTAIHFNSRPPHGGRRLPFYMQAWYNKIFQLTTSTRRSTKWGCAIFWTPRHFNSRPPHGGRHLYSFPREGFRVFQLTTSTRRSTLITSMVTPQLEVFQLTTSTRRSTCDLEGAVRGHGISTHDLHTEVDMFSFIILCS